MKRGVELGGVELLTPENVESARLPRGKKLHKLSDGRGLFLQIDEHGKAWRFRYRRAGKDALMSLGVYPAVSLAQARTAAAAARLVIDCGGDPQAARQRERDQRWLETAKTFGVVAAEYNTKQAHRAVKTVERCERLFRHSSRLHGKPFTAIDRPMLLQCCRALEHAGKHETAHRLGIYFAQVFRYARDEGYFTGVDPTIGGFGKSLKPVRETHQAALTDPSAVGGLMRNIDSWEWLGLGKGAVGANVGRALQHLARTAVRPGELRQAEWAAFDLEKATWVIPLARMKMRNDGRRADHVIPLSRQ